jgi:hypothetical protein
MQSTFENFKNAMKELHTSSLFKNTYQAVSMETLANETWTREENEAMQLLSEGHGPDFIKKQTQLDKESNQKIADLYFIILLNTLIRLKNVANSSLPFIVPKNEITSWTNDFPRNHFISLLDRHKDTMAVAADYAMLYKSTVGDKETFNQKTSQERSCEKNTSKKVSDNKSLDFAYGVVDGLCSMRVSSKVLNSDNTALKTGYALGTFAKFALEIGKVASLAL